MRLYCAKCGRFLGNISPADYKKAEENWWEEEWRWEGSHPHPDFGVFLGVGRACKCGKALAYPIDIDIED